MFEDYPGSVYRQKLSPLVEEFYGLYPQYCLDIRFHKTSSQLDMFMDNVIDIGFISRKPITNKVEIRPYLKYSWILVSRADFDIPDVITLSELVALEWIKGLYSNRAQIELGIVTCLQLLPICNKQYT